MASSPSFSLLRTPCLSASSLGWALVSQRSVDDEIRRGQGLIEENGAASDAKVVQTTFTSMGLWLIGTFVANYSED